jgi:hypothetical protein
MKFTNAHLLPTDLFNVLRNDVRRPEKGLLHVTELIGPPLPRILAMKHWDELEQDVSDMLWLLLGKGVHKALEGGAPEGSLSEYNIKEKWDGTTVTGTFDRWYLKRIRDWKVTSVYSFLLGDKPEWEAQLNIYRALCAAVGIPVDYLTINAILRDHMKSKSKSDADYPVIPFQAVDLPLWTPADTLTYIKDHIARHQAAELSMDAPCCSDAERWARPTTFAVIKKGQKRAKRVLDTLEDAEEWAKNNVAGWKVDIVERPGAHIKCQSYCIARAVCPHNPYLGQEPATDEEEAA